MLPEPKQPKRATPVTTTRSGRVSFDDLPGQLTYDTIDAAIQARDAGRHSPGNED